MSLYPFFCYYGGKWRAAKRYPAPEFNTIVEPFAGAAGYSVRYHDRDIVLYDTNPVVCGIWDYLTKVDPSEILRLPTVISHVDEIPACQEAKWLVGFWLNKGASQPCLTPSSWMRSGIRPNSYWGDVIRDRLASQVDKIRHWKIFQRSYADAENFQATWFVDPPYAGDCGKYYRDRNVDYCHLANWCRNLKGQAIVCEQHGASWLPFEPFHTIKSTPGSRGKSSSREVIWKNTA